VFILFDFLDNVVFHRHACKPFARWMIGDAKLPSAFVFRAEKASFCISQRLPDVFLQFFFAFVRRGYHVIFLVV